MKRVWIILILLHNISVAFSQPFEFKKHIIDSTITGYAGLISGDINRDGYIDIAGTSLNGNEIILWLNNGRTNISWKKIIIDSSFLSPLYIHISDLNNDRRPDLVAGSGVGTIAWWESENSNFSKWTKHVVDTEFAGAHGILACDMNNDNYIDILSSSADRHSIAWWENHGDDPPTWTKHIICDNFHTSQSCYAIDIDNDEDTDIIGASSDDDEIAVWYNTDDKATKWKKQVITDSFDLAHWVYSYDLDNDGDNDIIGAACIDGEIAWWENVSDGHHGWIKHIVGNEFACALTALPADFNNDEYPDIYASAWLADEISIWENTGNPASGWIKHEIDTSLYGAWPIHANDFDNDGDIDLVAGGDILNRPGTNSPLYLLENQLIATRSASDISKDKVLKELEIIRTSINELHPGLTLYRTEKNIKSKFDSIKCVINSSELISLSECLSLYKALCRYINCGHTVVYDPGAREDGNVSNYDQGHNEVTDKEIVKNGSCKLVLPTFYTVELRRNGVRYKNYLKSFFREARKENCKEIVIDIRGNRGGSVHMAAYLASFIIDSCFTFFNSVELTEQKKITCDKFLEKDAFYRFRRLITTSKGDKRYYRLHRELRPRRAHRLSPGSEVKFKILIDNKTFSAATMFAAVCKAKSDASFIGEKTAGKCIGSGLNPLKLTLPYTHFIIEIPLAYIYLSVEGLDTEQLYRGVKPDYDQSKEMSF